MLYVFAASVVNLGVCAQHNFKKFVIKLNDVDNNNQTNIFYKRRIYSNVIYLDSKHYHFKHLGSLIKLYFISLWNKLIK